MFANIRWPLFVRKAHKWVALLIGLQAVLWTATGFYMVAVHIDTIHGDHLVRTPDVQPFQLDELIAPGEIVARYPNASAIELQRLFGRPVWRVDAGGGPFLIDAKTGSALAPMTEAQVRLRAREIYTGDEPISSVRLLTEAPQEVQTRRPPFWQVEFARWNKPTLYISPATGDLISRRHALWRVFDFAWMLHIMDYEGRTNVNNPLLRGATWSAVLLALSGAWLLVWSFPRRKRKKA